MINAIDEIIKRSLRQLANDPLVATWHAKERDWVNYFAHQYLLTYCSPEGPLKVPAQIGIEVAVAQPPGYIKLAVSRDVVIWQSAGDTCFNDIWHPAKHPLAIVEWKVHRPGYRNVKVDHERKWLRAYCAWQPNVVCYAVEVDGTHFPFKLVCSRFLGAKEDRRWLASPEEELHTPNCSPSGRPDLYRQT